MTFKLFDSITLKSDVGNLRKGTRGVIVEQYSNGDVEVEFFSKEGETIAVHSLPLSMISSLSISPVIPEERHIITHTRTDLINNGRLKRATVRKTKKQRSSAEE